MWKVIQKLNSQLQHRHNNYNQNNNTVRDIKIWTTVTYYSPLICKITNLFKHINVRISFKNTNTIHDLTKPKTNNNLQEHKKCGTYKLTCNTSKLSYVWKTSCNLKQRYQEHIRYIRQNDPQSAYILQILNNNHEHGCINTTMSLLKQITKPHYQFLINNFISNHTIITRNSYQCKT